MALTLNNDLKTLKVGDYFWCHYKVTTANTVGVFSDIATKTDAEATPVIPVASSNLPNGYFRYIMVEDWNGTKRLIADRNIQHSISWDVLNTKGIASGSGLPMLFDGYESDKWSFAVRLMAGGTASTDKDNEWDRYIANSTLDGSITAGDDSIWNWSGKYPWTSTTHNSAMNRVTRGYSSSSTWAGRSSTDSVAVTAIRPVLEIEDLITTLNKSFILLSDGYKKLSEGNAYQDAIYKNLVPTMSSNTTPSGVASASSITSAGYDSWKAFDKENFYGWATNSTPTGWLSYDFKSPTTINQYTISMDVSGWEVNAPKNFTFEGWNGSGWIILDTKSNITDWVVKQKKIFNISNVSSYTMYRVNVTAINGGTQLYIGELELNKLVSNIVPATPPSWKTVSPTLPTLTQFQTEGMDDLSILDRKVQPVLESPQAMTSEVLGEGKVFKGEVDLKKYFDLRKLEVK